MRLQPQVEQLLVLSVVVMLLALDPGIGKVRDAGREPMSRARVAYQLRQGLDRELLGELVEDPILALIGRVVEGQPDAGDRVPDVEEAARLAALAVDRERLPDRRLD